MPADYGKLFRPVEGTEPPVDETAHTYFDANTSYPPSPTPTSPPEPNAVATPSTSDGAQQFAPAPLEPPPAPPKPPAPPLPTDETSVRSTPLGSPPPQVRTGGPRPAHSRHTRRRHRYRLDSESDELTTATGLSIPLRPHTDTPGPETPVGPESSSAPLPSHEPNFTLPATKPPPAPAPIEPAPVNSCRVEHGVPEIATSPIPAQPAKQVSQRGWRRWVRTLTGINLGLSRDEKYELDLLTRICRRPRGSYQIGVLALKGGVGKTTLTAVLGSTLAHARGDRILVLDADPHCGNLADRTGRSSTRTIADLLADKNLSHYNDIRAYTSVNETKLEILSAENYAKAPRGLTGEDWHFTAKTVSKFYNLVLADCGAGMFDPVTHGVLSTASALVIVTSVSIDSARQTSMALDWLRNNGYPDLLGRVCVVINHVTSEKTNISVNELIRQFEQQVQPDRLVVVPWDKHIAAGTKIQLGLLDPAYKLRMLELAAALSDDFEKAGRR